jgi:hypothetical protein
MINLILVSESNPDLSLQTTLNELAKEAILLSNPINFDQGLRFLKNSNGHFVLINAAQRKLEAFELCQQIKQEFKGRIKVFVYLPNASLNEASKFGSLNAEVEDEQSIRHIASKISIDKNQQYLYDELTISICSLYGGLGASHLAVLLAYTLGLTGHHSLLLESSNNFTLKKILNIDNNLALLETDQNKGNKQILDEDWLSNFLTKLGSLPNTYYLNLFNSLDKRLYYLLQNKDTCKQINEIAKSSRKILDKCHQSPEPNEFSNAYALKEIKQQLLNIDMISEQLYQDIEGQSLTIFDRIIGLGSKFATTMIFDLSTDLVSPLNRQFLHLSKFLLVLLKDDELVKMNYLALRNFITEQYPCTIIPVLIAEHDNYLRYQNINDEAWFNILGTRPLIYPYKLDSIIKLGSEAKHLNSKDPLLKFARELLRSCSAVIDSEADNERILDLLMEKYVR